MSEHLSGAGSAEPTTHAMPHTLEAAAAQQLGPTYGNKDRWTPRQQATVNSRVIAMSHDEAKHEENAWLIPCECGDCGGIESGPIDARRGDRPCTCRD